MSQSYALFKNMMPADGSSSWADDEVENEVPAHVSHTRKDSDDYVNRSNRSGSADYGTPEPKVTKPLPENPPYCGYVGNLSYDVNEDNLRDFFKNCSIQSVRLPFDKEHNRCKGFAYVTFDDQASLAKSLEYDGQVLLNRPVRVDIAQERRPNTSYGDRHRGGRHNNRYDRRPSTDHGGIVDTDPVKPIEFAETTERRKIRLLPRTASTDEAENSPRNPSIFGMAKPRDERQYVERKRVEKSRSTEDASDDTKKPVEGKDSTHEHNHGHTDSHKHGGNHRDKASRPHGANGRHGHRHVERGDRHEKGGERQERGDRGRSSRGGTSFRGGRGGGRGRSSGRGNSHDGRRENAGSDYKKEELSSTTPDVDQSKKIERKPKKEVKPRNEAPPATKAANTRNAYSLLGDDSDSDD